MEAGRSSVAFLVDIPETAVYTLALCYLTGDTLTAELEVSFEADGRLPFTEAGGFTLPRFWMDGDEARVDGNGNEFSSKWGKYKLTLPVKRIDIVKSLYINQLLWIMIGVLFVGIIIALSYLLHGITFEQFEGISGVLVVGISISLSMGAIFIPMVYLAGEDKTIVFLIISLICALGIVTMLFNIPLFGPFILIGCSILLFIVSFPLTVGIFKKKEY